MVQTQLVLIGRAVFTHKQGKVDICQRSPNFRGHPNFIMCQKKAFQINFWWPQNEKKNYIIFVSLAGKKINQSLASIKQQPKKLEKFQN